MKLQFLVTVTIGKYDKSQTRKDFEHNDGKDMIPYIKEKLQDAVAAGETWQNNAIVTRSTVKQVKQRKKK